MIGHYLLTLMQEQEDRVLTTSMAGFPASRWNTTTVCLVMVANDIAAGRTICHLPKSYGWPRNEFAAAQQDFRGWVTRRYDNLCDRFGVERVNGAIRSRILANQARRALAGVRETVNV